jgi:hypothetical protein
LLEGKGCNPQDSPNLCVSLGILSARYNENAPAAEFATNVYAEVSYGVGGGPASALVDFRTGAQLSVPAQSFTIRALMLPSNTETGEWSDNDPLEVTVSASFGEGSRAARAFNTYTPPARELAAAEDPGDTVNFNVPSLAYGLQVYSPDSRFFSPGNVSVLFNGTDGQVGYTGGLIVHAAGGGDLQSGLITDGHRIPANARSVAFINNLPAELPFTASFILSI